MSLIDDFKNRQTDKDGAIKAGALNLTIVSSCIAVMGGALTVILGLFDDIFGPDASDSVKLGFFVALIAAATFMVIADVLARSRVAAAVAKSTHVFATEAGLPATIEVPEEDAKGQPMIRFDEGWTIDMVEVNGDNGVARFHVVKDDEGGEHQALWEDARNVRLAEPQVPAGNGGGRRHR